MIKLDNNRKELYQWDVGVVGTLTINGVDEIHFSNLRYGISFNVKVVDNKVKFPPEVLQSGADVFCWAFVRGENGGYTKKEQIFNVEKRPRPADYVYEPTEVLTWEELKQDIEKLEKGTIPTMDKVNVWELEAGAYYVNHIVCYATPNIPLYPNIVEMQSKKGLLYVHIDISNNTTRNFYLFANGNIYFGTSTPNVLDVADGIGSISSVVAAIKNEITSENGDGIPTKNAVYNFGETLKTELLADIGNKADRTEVETALSGKVNKSDILTVIDTDEVYTDTQFYNANVVNSVLDLLVDKNNILTEIDYNASADNIYNAIVINSITQQINETFATKAYVNEVIGGIENGSY